MKERGSKISLVFDVLNIGNLLNKKWGTYYSNTFNTPIITVDKVDTKTLTPSYTFGATEVYKNDYSSRWHMQLGLRVTF